jgi:hypothetical protein
MLLSPIIRSSISLQLLTPNRIFHFRDIVPISLYRTQILIKGETRTTGYLCYTKRCARWVKSCRYHDSRNMVHGNHVHGVVDLGSASQLDTAEDHTGEEIVGVGYAAGFVTGDVTGSYDAAA